ncbi:transglutaminase domain-containing protein, partial [candidate division WOR-3 bacterium]|nr:transglutaminase domain-containing protein [candidate division WOR-3 bacterium]
ATLFVALSRAAGIPTDISVGLVYMNGYFYYHAWNKVWVGKWIEVDPTFNQPIADATHITLEEGGLQDWAKIMDLVGNIEIEVIEYR